MIMIEVFEVQVLDRLKWSEENNPKLLSFTVCVLCRTSLLGS